MSQGCQNPSCLNADNCFFSASNSRGFLSKISSRSVKYSNICFLNTKNPPFIHPLEVLSFSPKFVTILFSISKLPNLAGGLTAVTVAILFFSIKNFVKSSILISASPSP